jgi:AcrR family transcriptional regulator
MKTKRLNKGAGARSKRASSATLRDQARQVYRDAILEAAEQVFGRRGFSGTRMADVAKAAGLATGTLYNYFANRNELLGSLVAQRSDELLGEMRAAEEETASRPACEQLGHMVRTAFLHFEAHRALFAVFLEPAGISGKSMASIGRSCIQAQREYHGVFAGVLDRSRAEGAVRADVPQSLLLAHLLGSLHGMVKLWMSEPDADPLTDRAALVVELFLRGAGNRS